MKQEIKTTHKDYIREAIQNLARKRQMKVGHVLDDKALLIDVIYKLEPVHQIVFEEVWLEFEKEGVFDKKGTLTQKGYDNLY